MRFLALTTRPLQSRGSGYDLRVTNLCAHLPGEVHHVVAPYQPVGVERPGLPLDDVFASHESLPPLATTRTGPTRHLRLSNARYLARTSPEATAAARARLAEIVGEREVTHVVVFGPEIAELVADLDGVVTVLDVCDSGSLTARREHPDGLGPRDWVRRLSSVADVARKRRTERRLPTRFDLVTAISDPDARAVEGPRPLGPVHVVPNGLDEAYAGPLPPPDATRRSVVFWGNLAFGPNRDALAWFVDEVFLPRLRDRGVELCVIGADAPSWLADRAAGEPAIDLPGFVEDLPAAVTRHPVMVNPMRSGSGLKNKVLEAMGLGLAVVSTPLGVEALPHVEDGAHVVTAPDPERFAAAVLALLDDEPRRTRLRGAAHDLVHEHYLWAAVGRAWRSLVVGAGTADTPSGDDRTRHARDSADTPHSIV